MMAGHGLMWSNIYQPDKPRVKRRVDWRRLARAFCSVLAAAGHGPRLHRRRLSIGLVPGFVVAHIIDDAIPQHICGTRRLNVGGMIGRR